MFDALPDDLGELVRIIQGLVVYDAVAADFYGFKIPDERRNEIHLRPVAKLLERLIALDGQPLTVARSVEKRLVGRCHHENFRQLRPSRRSSSSEHFGPSLPAS